MALFFFPPLVIISAGGWWSSNQRLQNIFVRYYFSTGRWELLLVLSDFISKRICGVSDPQHLQTPGWSDRSGPIWIEVSIVFSSRRCRSVRGENDWREAVQQEINVEELFQLICRIEQATLRKPKHFPTELVKNNNNKKNIEKRKRTKVCVLCF